MKRTPLARKTPLYRKTPLRARGRTKSVRPDARYLAWVRTLSCLICGGAKGKSEAAHTKQLGHSGTGIKSADRSTVPLCVWCHRLTTDAYHAITPESRWEAYHGLDLSTLVLQLNSQYDKRAAKKAALLRSIGEWVSAIVLLGVVWAFITLTLQP